MNSKKSQKVAVITGFYQTSGFLITLFDYLNKQSYKDFDVYVYNYDVEHIDALTTNTYFFQYKILKLSENVGFAGGNNHAIQAAKEHHDYDYYALINDDTKPEADWLANLVATATDSTIIGAVASKMLFYEPFVMLRAKLQASEEEKVKRGIKFYGNSGFDGCYYSKKFYKKGFWEEEEDSIYQFRWTKSEFEVVVPVVLTGHSDDYILKLFLRKNEMAKEQKLYLTIGSFKVAELNLHEDQLFYPVTIPAKVIERTAAYMIQNAGSDYDVHFNGFDIGSGEFDKGQYNNKREVNMFCGGACLLTKAALQKTGLFNRHYFSYYEDSDLSIRLKRAGFKIVYNPEAVVLHHHSGSGKEWSPFFTYHVFRNKIIFSAKNFGIKGFVFSFKERLKETWVFAKWLIRNRFRDPNLKARLKLNYRILLDSMIGIVKYKPTRF